MCTDTLLFLLGSAAGVGYPEIQAPKLLFKQQNFGLVLIIIGNVLVFQSFFDGCVDILVLVRRLFRIHNKVGFVIFHEATITLHAVVRMDDSRYGCSDKCAFFDVCLVCDE